MLTTLLFSMKVYHPDSKHFLNVRQKKQVRIEMISQIKLVNLSMQNFPKNPLTNSAQQDKNNLRLWNPPSETVVVKVPPIKKEPFLCTKCDAKFAENKSLVKHNRNHHQTYKCGKCGITTEGYYKMASHTKKYHVKEPVLCANVEGILQKNEVLQNTKTLVL